MQITLDQHPEQFFLLPILCLTTGECEDPHCDARHTVLSLGLFIWSAHLILTR